MIDLNAKRAARAARNEGGGKPVPIVFGEDTYYVPPELPMAIVDRVLSPDMEIAQLLILLIRAVKTNVAEGKPEQAIGDLDFVAESLTSNAELPFGVYQSIRQAIAEVLGEEQWERYLAQKPALEDTLELLWELIKLYGSRLGELFKSFGSAKSAGETSSATSSGSTDSMPGGSGLAPETPASLESVG